MAIRFGMTLAEMIVQLTKGFRKATGRNPDGLEKIKIQQEAVQRFKDMNKIVDMEGNVLDPSKPIMGGTQEGAALRSGIMRATKARPKPVTSLDDEIKQAYDKAVKENKFKNVRLKDGRKIESEEDFREYIDELNEDSNFADGGRIGFKKGMDRRTFMKIMGGLTTLPILGKFFKGAEVAAPAVEKAVEAAKTVPPYFLKLAEQIKLLGRQSSGPQERINVYSMKGKDGKSELMLTEDVGTGEMQIKKIGKENDEMVTEVQTMEYTPGKAQADETTKGTPADQYEEYTEYNSRIQKDEFNEPDIVDGIDAEDISKEIKDKFDVEQEILEEVARDKKASGGIAMMLGQ